MFLLRLIIREYFWLELEGIGVCYLNGVEGVEYFRWKEEYKRKDIYDKV